MLTRTLARCCVDEWATEPSFVWYHDETGGHEAKPFALDGDYSPYVGDFDADGCHDVA